MPAGAAGGRAAERVGALDRELAPLLDEDVAAGAKAAATSRLPPGAAGSALPTLATGSPYPAGDIAS